MTIAAAAVDAQPSFLATLAHELRGPMTALETASELLERDFESLDDHQIRAMVSGIHGRALWMRGLIENLLCRSAVNDGRLQVQRRPMDMRSAVEEACSVVEPLLARRRQRTKIVSDPALPLAAADPHRISQVLLNLLSNAQKYSASDTEIQVMVCARGSSIRVSVADEGPGIPTANAVRLFDPYERGGRTDGDGLGIGLSVVRSIIDAHGGRVGAANRTEGGAMFWFEVPMSVFDPKAPPAQDWTQD